MKSLSLGSSSIQVVCNSVAAGLSLADLDDDAVCLELPKTTSSTGTGTTRFVTGGGEGNFVCFLLDLWASHLTSHFMSDWST